MIPLGVETRPPHVFESAGTQVPPQPVEVRSSGLSSLERGFIPGGIVIPSGMETRPPHAIVSAGTLPLSRFQPTCIP